jgi:alpha-glucosidase
MMAGSNKELTASIIREPIEEFLKYKDSWPSWAFTNHDVVRAASRWHPGDGFGHDPRLSKMLIALLGALYGTVFMYQGEELGLPEAKLKREELRDPWGIRLYPKWQGRDGCRTPIPWDDTPQKSWLPVPAAHYGLNVAAQEKDKNSILNFTREFLKWRKTKPELREGDIKFIETGDEKILAFSRGKMKCVFNLGLTEKTWQGEKLAAYGFSFSD